MPLPTLPLPGSRLLLEPPVSPARLVARIRVPPVVSPPPPPSLGISIGGLKEPLVDLADLPERPRTPAVRNLTSNFERHPVLGGPLPEKRPSRAQVPGVLAEANSAGPSDEFAVPLVDAVEWAVIWSSDLEPRTLTDALKRADADKWVAAALAEMLVLDNSPLERGGSARAGCSR